MKRLFNVLLVIALMLSATSVSARGFRNGHRGYHDFYTVTDGMGISVGYAHSAYRLSDWATDEVKKADGLNGLNFLVTKDFSIYEDMIFLQPGVGYTYLNDSRNMSEGTVRIIGDWDEHYLSIPVKIKYELPIMENVCVFAKAGPTLVAGMSSSMKYRARIGDENAAISYNVYSGKVRSNDVMPGAVEAVIRSQFPAARYRRADLQFGLSAGAVLFELLEAEIGYDWGIVNKLKEESIDDLKMRRQQFYITVGIRF